MENTTPAQQAPVTQVDSGMSTQSAYKFVVAILVVVIFVLAAGFGYLFLKKSSSPLLSQQTQTETATSASIEGTLDINGAIPDGATLDLVAKSLTGNGDQTTFASGISPDDNNTWTFADATANTSYEVQAIVMLDGKVISKSGPVSVTAPATNAVLTLNIESATNAANATIAGDIVVNGYIPDGATITVKGRTLGAQNFTTVASNLNGASRQIMTYATAKSGTSYEVQGLLVSADGKTIGASDLLTVTAPAAHEVLSINSSAQAPAATPQPTAAPAASTQPKPTPTAAPQSQAAISGNVTVNGVAPVNSRIVILAKQYNSSNYTVVVDNLQPSSGVTWKWKDPTQSTWFDIVAVMKQRQSDGTDKDITTSSKVTVAAPASNTALTLNTGFSLNAPNGQISVDCGNQSGTNWNAKVTFGAESNAGSYWFQIGSSNGGHELTDATTNANGNNPLVLNFPLNNGSTYYARYAYSTQPNLNTGNSQYSAFSATQEIKCGG